MKIEKIGVLEGGLLTLTDHCAHACGFADGGYGSEAHEQRRVLDRAVQALAEEHGTIGVYVSENLGGFPADYYVREDHDE